MVSSVWHKGTDMRSLMKYFRWLWHHSKGARWSICLNVLLGVVNVGLNMAFILFCKRLVDIATGEVQGGLGLYTGIVIAILVLRLGVSAVNVRVENLTTSRMNFIIRKDLYSQLLQAEWLGKEKRHTGDTINRLETDVNTVTGVICSDFPQFFTTIVQLIAAVVFLCFMDWRLTLALLIITPLFVLFSKVFFKKMRTMTRDIRDTESQVQSHLQESLQHRMVIQSMENEGRMEDRLDNLQQLEYGQVVVRTRFNIFARTMVSAAFSFGYIAAFLRGVYGIYNGTLTYGVMTAFLQLVAQVQRPVVNLTRQERSQYSAIFSRWVMKIMVLPAALFVSFSIRRASVSGSREELNSSSSITCPGRSRPRAMAMRCAWPSLRPVPPSPQRVSSPSGRL